MSASAAWKLVRRAGSLGKAARSAVRRAGELDMLPRRVIRRPAWSGWFEICQLSCAMLYIAFPVRVEEDCQVKLR